MHPRLAYVLTRYEHTGNTDPVYRSTNIGSTLPTSPVISFLAAAK
jgi:hypothetical protein